MRDDAIERLQIFSMTALAAALLGSLIGIGGALVKNIQPRPIVIVTPAPVVTSAPATVRSGQEPYARLLKALETPRRPAPAPAPVLTLPPPRPRIIAIATNAEHGVSCIVEGLAASGDQVELRPGGVCGDHSLLRIEVGDKASRIVLLGPQGEWSLPFGGEEDARALPE